jgi:tight adherence protein B
MIRSLARRRRRILRVLPLAFAALVAAPSALAGLHLAAVDTVAFPSVHVTLVTPAGSPVPRLRENGRPVTGYTAVNLGQEKAIVLALDRSQSMRGRPLAQAIGAAQAFTRAAGARDHVGVVTFGSNAIALGRLSDGPSEARSSLAGIGVDSQPGTALYDAIVLAAKRLGVDERPGRAIVVVTDGRDVSSTHTLQDAVDVARRAHVAVYPIGIGGPSFAPTVLRQIARETGGSYRQAARASALGSVYTSVAEELDRTWQVAYVTAARPGATLHLEARVSNVRSVETTVKIDGKGPGNSGGSRVIPAVGYTVGGTAFVALTVGLLVVLACCFWFASLRGSKLRARIEPHLGITETNAKTRRRNERAAARARVADTIERILGDLRQFKRVQATIERADLPLRAGELVAASVALAFGVALVTGLAGAPPIVVLVLMLVAGSIPFAYVTLKASMRVRRFENQLPDILITIAASLKAGHSFRQGIQSVVDEGSEPSAKEFRRVLTETQLGKTMDDALGDFAERIGSKNLTFVINAVTIQRQIGGTLAGLFDMVADTVRQRQQFARKVKGLTAMGRMSAYVLVALPFFVGAVVTMMNPTYMSPLYHTATGQKVLAGGIVMIVVGSAMLKKTISFKG